MSSIFGAVGAENHPNSPGGRVSGPIEEDQGSSESVWIKYYRKISAPLTPKTADGTYVVPRNHPLRHNPIKKMIHPLL